MRTGEILRQLSDENDRQKRISDELLNINANMLGRVNGSIRGHLDANSYVLQGQGLFEYKMTFMQSILDRWVIRRFINTMPTNVPSTEPTEICLDRVHMQTEIDGSTKRANLIQSAGGNMGEEFSKLVRIRDFLSRRNQELTDQHIALVNFGLTIDRAIDVVEGRSSLVDDYADVSSDMPSYMDPED